MYQFFTNQFQKYLNMFTYVNMFRYTDLE